LRRQPDGIEEARVSDNFSQLLDWARACRDDVETLKAVVSSDKANKAVRRHAAAALNYLLSKMDLIPDWEPTLGILDDVMVIRICAAHGAKAAGDEDGLDDKTSLAFARLANQEERIAEVLGPLLHGKLRAHSDKVLLQAVRQRTPDTIVSDPAVRARVFAEVDEVLKSVPAIDAATDPSALEAKLKGYLQAKLK
jgi:uncharacterized membrane protein YkvA (DUF1232 family)